MALRDLLDHIQLEIEETLANTLAGAFAASGYRAAYCPPSNISNLSTSAATKTFCYHAVLQEAKTEVLR